MIPITDRRCVIATRILPVSDLKRNTRSALETVNSTREALYITHHGRPKAVLLSYEAYEELLARLEDLADLASLRESAAEPSRPFDEFLEETGAR